MRILPFFLVMAVFLGGLTDALQQPTRVGPIPQGGHIVPSQQVVHPAGDSVSFGGRPVDLALSPDGKTLYVKDNRGLLVIDAPAWKLRQELKFRQGGGSMHGIAVSRDGKRVYATTAQNHLAVAQVQSDSRLVWERAIVLPGPGEKGDSHPCGIALSRDGRRAFVCLSRNNSLAIVDLAQGKVQRKIPVGVAPMDVALSADGRTAYVSNWGGRRPRRGERTAKSSGTDTLVDARGIAASGSVSIVDLARGREVAQIETDLHPSDLEISRDGRTLYVANANSDTVSILSLRAQRVAETVSVRPVPGLPFGSAPNGLALGKDGQTLYVANGGNNAVAVIVLGGKTGRKSRVEGFIPVGWYPGGVITDGRYLYVANVKGLGSRGAPPDAKRRQVYEYLGTLNRIPLPSRQQLRAYTAQVLRNARVAQMQSAREKAQRGVQPVSVPLRVGEPSVFQHVVYIIKENRTYDQVFGDLPQGNADPALCIYGREVTPNHHALAEQFVLLDNFYCNGVNSADGHSWATEGNVTDHLEKSFGGFTRSYTFGDDPLTYSSSGFIWDNVLSHGLTFRNYGEMDYAEPVPGNATFSAIYQDFTSGARKIRFTHNIGIARLRRYSARDYPGWNMRIPDILRADVFIRELKQYEKKGNWPNFLIVYLPNDHTSGTTPGMPTPRAHVADNDLALGRVVEAITRSKFWPRTCIFVIEDDPQDGFDHVDGHRSLCLVISPYTKRGAVISTFYNQTSVLHTMQRILGLPAMNQMDSMSNLMRDCFTEVPDLRPYKALPNRVPLDELNPPAKALKGKALHWARKSRELPLSRPDRADEALLNRILWHAARGTEAPYPAHLAGAHGRGLKALGLKLAPEEPERD